MCCLTANLNWRTGYDLGELIEIRKIWSAIELTFHSDLKEDEIVMDFDGAIYIAEGETG